MPTLTRAPLDARAQLTQPAAMSSSPPYTSAEFHDAVQKQIAGIVTAALADSKLEWSQVAPFLDAARAICRDDVLLNGRFVLHGLEEGDEGLTPADEAFLSVSVRDREDGTEWLSQSYWLSDIVLSDSDPDRVRSTVAGIERTVERLKTWLAEQEAPGADVQAEAPTPSP
jgi:hypothetical protein